MVWPPLFGAVVRVGIALLCLMLFIFSTRKNTAIAFSLRWKVWMIGIFSQAIPFTCLFWGERHISPGLAGILNGTVSIWTFLLSIVLLPQLTTYSVRKVLGLLVGIVGVVIIFWPMVTVDNSISTLLGAAAIVVMAISYALGAVLNQYFLSSKSRIDFFANIYHQHWGSLIFLVVISLLFEKWPSASVLFSSHIPWFASLYLGVFSTAIAWLLYYHLIREWDALRASTVLYVVPALTLIWDYLIFGNRPHLTEIMGVVAILSGVILIQLSNFKRIGKAR